MFKTALLSLILILVGSEIYFQVRRGQVVQRVLAAESERSVATKHLLDLQAYWEKIIADSPAYRDGYVQLANIETALGDSQKSAELWAKIYSLDPNFQPAPTQ